MRCLTILPAVISMLFGSLCHSLAQQPDVSDVLRRWEKAILLVTRDCAYECESNSAFDSGPGLGLAYRFERQKVVSRDDGSYDVTLTRWPQTNEANAKHDPRDAYVLRIVRIGDLKPYPCLSIMTTSRGITMQASKQAGGDSIISLSGFEITCTDSSPSYLLRHGGARLRPVREGVNASNCYVIDAKTEFGACTFWIDPEHGWNVAKSEGHQQRGDRVWNGYATLPHAYPNRASGGLQSDLVAVEKYEVSSSFGHVAGTWQIEAIKHRLVQHLADGTTLEGNTQLRRWNVEFHPNFANLGAFKLDYPDGIPVFVGDQPGLSFEWRDGKVMPRTQ